MQSRGLRGMLDEQLREILKERKTEKKRRELEIKETSKRLRKMKVEYYQFSDAVSETKETLGGRKGEKCPALKAAKSTYGGGEVVCKAKRYKYHCWNKEEMYRQHCFVCHLTSEQARTAMMYDRILIGKRENV